MIEFIFLDRKNEKIDKCKIEDIEQFFVNNLHLAEFEPETKKIIEKIYDNNTRIINVKTDRKTY